jgi:hypothetical protein
MIPSPRAGGAATPIGRRHPSTLTLIEFFSSLKRFTMCRSSRGVISKDQGNEAGWHGFVIEAAGDLCIIAAMPPLPLILDLNASCPGCHYSIPPQQMIVVSTGNLACPKCHAVFLAQKGEPIGDKKRPQPQPGPVPK